MEVLGRTLAQDQARFLDLLLALTSYCGTSILALQAVSTLADLEDALRDAGDEAEPAAPLTAGFNAGPSSSGGAVVPGPRPRRRRAGRLYAGSATKQPPPTCSTSTPYVRPASSAGRSP